MTPLEMIAEWRKGCSNAGPMHSKCFPDGEPIKTGYCVECTEALIDALEAKIREQQVEPVAVLRFASKVPGNENEMPVVLSCNRLPDGEYRVFLDTPGDAALRKALEPFAKAAEVYDDLPNYQILDIGGLYRLTVSDFRRAREILATPPSQDQTNEVTHG